MENLVPDAQREGIINSKAEIIMKSSSKPTDKGPAANSAAAGPATPKILPDRWLGTLTLADLAHLKPGDLDPDGDPLLATTSGDGWHIDIAVESSGPNRAGYGVWINAAYWDGRDWADIANDSECGEVVNDPVAAILSSLEYGDEAASEAAEVVLEHSGADNEDGAPTEEMRRRLACCREVAKVCVEAAAHLRNKIESGAFRQ